MYVYRAYKQVKLGKLDEHAYNMFLSVWQMWHRLGLWNTMIAEQQLYLGWERIQTPMYYANLRRQLHEENEKLQTHSRFNDKAMGKIPAARSQGPHSKAH
jgi:hypothetical protein